MSDMQQLIRRDYDRNDIENPLGRGNGCGCNAPRLDLEAVTDGAPYTYGGGCGSCACPSEERWRVCGFGVEDGILAAVYAPLNRFDGVYDPDTAMRRGTMFEGLDKPFYGDGKGVDCRGNEK